MVFGLMILSHEWIDASISQRHRLLIRPIIHPLMQQMFDWFEAGKLNPRIWKTYKLEDFQDAMAAVLGRDAIGRVAVVMDEEAKRLGH